jgi:hypothetical protein
MLRETFCTLILLKPALEVVQNERECNKLCPGAGDRIRDYFVTNWCGAVGAAISLECHGANVTLGRDT